MSIENHYNKDIDIYRETLSTGYSPVSTWNLLSSVRGMIDLLRGSERLGDDGKTVIADHRLYIDITDINLLDRCLVDEIIYEIVNIHNPNERDHHYEIELKRMVPGTARDMGIGS